MSHRDVEVTLGLLLDQHLIVDLPLITIRYQQHIKRVKHDNNKMHFQLNSA